MCVGELSCSQKIQVLMLSMQVSYAVQVCGLYMYLALQQPNTMQPHPL